MTGNRLVMIPGPTPVARSIAEQMGRDIQAFGDPRFVADYKGLIDGLRALLNCKGAAFPIAGTGTLAMEMAIANSTKKGDSVLIASNGFFGDRFIDICKGKGLDVDVLQAEWGRALGAAEIDAALSKKDYAAVTVTHVDTSTAVVAPVAEIGAMIREKHAGTLYIVDGVAATAAEFEDVDGMGIDILFTGSQKAFGVCPGLLILWAGPKALARREALGQIPEYYVDIKRWMPVMEDPSKYFATPAVNLVWALAESLRIIQAEGLRQRYERHLKNSRALHAAFEALGLRILADPGCRAVTLTTLVYPEGVQDAAFRGAVMEEGAIVAGALGAYAGKAFRMGHMGNIDTNDMVAMLGIIERALRRCGAGTAASAANVAPGAGVSAYLAAMAG